ncbi:DUF551 domain-containing protein [Serratia fonticola]|uniref:DUF551 domain-containing protein n=1 Tax=Serratia fonticola TaxID=47917 RepID=UPI0034C67E89
MKIELLGGPYHGRVGDSAELSPPVDASMGPPNSLVMNPNGSVYILHSRSEDGRFQYRYEDNPCVVSDAKSQFISVDERLPESKEGRWSAEVIALGDAGDVFKLSCMGSYWQRTKAFIESDSEKITHWMPLIYPD